MLVKLLFQLRLHHPVRSIICTGLADVWFVAFALHNDSGPQGHDARFCESTTMTLCHAKSCRGLRQHSRDVRNEPPSYVRRLLDMHPQYAWVVWRDSHETQRARSCCAWPSES
jgi:hypothetical protein